MTMKKKAIGDGRKGKDEVDLPSIGIIGGMKGENKRP